MSNELCAVENVQLADAQDTLSMPIIYAGQPIDRRAGARSRTATFLCPIRDDPILGATDREPVQTRFVEPSSREPLRQTA
jgi:hypothetical protein